ncbi:MAG: AAA family ATPase, partial [Caldithrix sp.]|nr:AAA family ATPase [Caldithrix sp.]
MQYIADLHIHSHYSIATSRNLIPEYLDYWARIKGIHVVGTGDFTHPGWQAELQEKLEPADEPGLWRLKDAYRMDAPQARLNETRFMLTTEISNIYKKNEKTRKVHNLIFAPDFETVYKISRELHKIGNITSDGRPILGLDSRDLLHIALQASDDIFFVPAHIWTPWFSALGAQSGFDTITDCYSDLAGHIYAVETGLSSDPPMNWMCRFLDGYTLISNSDAHSPEKLGREANLFEGAISYYDMIKALKDPGHEAFMGTVEFFPQEGKYHYDGHRKCGMVWNPLETLQHGGLCPVCGKPVTEGVMHRVAQLSDRDDISERVHAKSFYSLIPLKEMIAEVTGTGPGSKKVNDAYFNLIRKGGSEFDILMNLPLEDIQTMANERLSEAIRRMRSREVHIEEGYDGAYGRVTCFREGELADRVSQPSLFGDMVGESGTVFDSRPLISFDLQAYRRMQEKSDGKTVPDHKTDASKTGASNILQALNVAQRKAVRHKDGPLLILAGPGTGKTKTLTHRIAYLIREHEVSPHQILAVTFSNKAAEEMSVRIKVLLQTQREPDLPSIHTFHAFGYGVLKKHGQKLKRPWPWQLIDRPLQDVLFKKHLQLPKGQLSSLRTVVHAVKQNNLSIDSAEDKDSVDTFYRYQNLLQKHNAFDLQDLIYETLRLFQQYPRVLQNYRKRFAWILVDEYQDINPAQYALIRLLAKDKTANLCAIGDPNQAIYGFRGADVSFIKRFQADYDGSTVYRLQQSYRCSNYILKASAGVLADKDNVLDGLQDGVRIHISEQKTDKSEAEFVARTIEAMMGGLRFYSMDSSVSAGHADQSNRSLQDFAVLCRIKNQMPALQKAFNDHSIPYQIVDHEPLFAREPARTILNIL